MENRLPFISLLLKPSSGSCNMACEYCFYADEMNCRSRSNFGMMSMGTLEQVVRKSMEIAVSGVSFAFQGGEPTLRGLDFFREFIALEKKYARPGLQISHSLQTNGYDIDEGWAKFLAENHFLVGVSLDGTEELHDRYRKDRDGQGTYHRVLDTLQLFDRHGVEYNILTVVNRDVAAHGTELYNHYRQLGLGYLQFIPCIEPFGVEKGQVSYAVTPEAYGTFLIDLFHCWYCDLKNGCQPYIRLFENNIGILLGYAPEACDQSGRCSIQHVVEADGSVYPCDFYVLDQYRLGNVNTDTFEQIEQKRADLKFIEESLKLNPACKACEHYALCRGGCQRNRVWNGSSYDYYFCKAYKMFFDACKIDLFDIAEKIKRNHS